MKREIERKRQRQQEGESESECNESATKIAGEGKEIMRDIQGSVKAEYEKERKRQSMKRQRNMHTEKE